MNIWKLEKLATECPETNSVPSRMGWAARCAALGVLSVLPAVSVGCSQAQAAESQDQQMNNGAQKHEDVSRNSLAGLYYARVVRDPGKAAQELPVKTDDAVMLGSDGSLTGFNGTQNAVAFDLFWTNTVGPLGSWQAHGKRIELKMFQMLTAPSGWIALNQPITFYQSYTGALVPTQYFGFETAHIEGEVTPGGVVTGRIHFQMFSTLADYCTRASGQTAPCLLRAWTGSVTLVRFDPAEGPPASLFQP